MHHVRDLLIWFVHHARDSAWLFIPVIALICPLVCNGKNVNVFPLLLNAGMLYDSWNRMLWFVHWCLTGKRTLYVYQGNTPSVNVSTIHNFLHFHFILQFIIFSGLLWSFRTCIKMDRMALNCDTEDANGYDKIHCLHVNVCKSNLLIVRVRRLLTD